MTSYFCLAEKWGLINAVLFTLDYFWRDGQTEDNESCRIE